MCFRCYVPQVPSISCGGCLCRSCQDMSASHPNLAKTNGVNDRLLSRTAPALSTQHVRVSPKLSFIELQCILWLKVHAMCICTLEQLAKQQQVGTREQLLFTKTFCCLLLALTLQKFCNGFVFFFTLFRIYMYSCCTGMMTHTVCSVCIGALYTSSRIDICDLSG